MAHDNRIFIHYSEVFCFSDFFLFFPFFSLSLTLSLSISLWLLSLGFVRFRASRHFEQLLVHDAESKQKVRWPEKKIIQTTLFSRCALCSTAKSTNAVRALFEILLKETCTIIATTFRYWLCAAIAMLTSSCRNHLAVLSGIFCSNVIKL